MAQYVFYTYDIRRTIVFFVGLFVVVVFLVGPLYFGGSEIFFCISGGVACIFDGPKKSYCNFGRSKISCCIFAL